MLLIKICKQSLLITNEVPSFHLPLKNKHAVFLFFNKNRIGIKSLLLLSIIIFEIKIPENLAHRIIFLHSCMYLQVFYII